MALVAHKDNKPLLPSLKSGEVVYNKTMIQKPIGFYFCTKEGGEAATARRKRLLETLHHERYLTWAWLIWRLEWVLGKGCYGKYAWQFVFYRDMLVVKAAYLAAGYDLAYSRTNLSFD